MDQDETWHEGTPRPGHIMLDRDPPILVHVYCGQMTGCIKVPLGTEVDLSPGHIVLDGDPAPPAC